ncbi:MAG: Helix-turn-helix domain [Acidobacteriota bacterium]|jgi:transcriptional regulator with XRE-family HTH domain|nr:Helix-turn-helix domain [Acidobacteriota bacterium]
MGYARPKPARLAGKLLQIRNALGLSQTEMLKRLGVEDMIAYHRISEYELGKREPLLMVLLQYARVASVPTEVLIDDELNLPDNLPGTTNHEEIKRRFAARSKKR